jgi:hypothetical protein
MSFLNVAVQLHRGPELQEGVQLMVYLFLWAARCALCMCGKCRLFD